MRRLASRTREDAYASKRDYQTLHVKQGVRLSVRDGNAPELVLIEGSLTKGNTNWYGFGGFVFPAKACSLTVSLESGASTTTREFHLAERWNRIGVIFEAERSKKLRVVMKWEKGISLSVWGLVANAIDLPEGVRELNLTLDTVVQTHLVPEGFYLPHEEAIVPEIDPDCSDTITLADNGETINLKKCSYCGRLLPVDPHRLGILSFGKHNAKRTKHQNECRACKTWRINRELNPLRTTDQLHESSVITRERKLFLREPEILQKIKDRTGAGLKSQVWERFDRKCFYCNRRLKLSEVQLDHTRPLAYLWPIDEHATCLCAEHNNCQRAVKTSQGWADENQPL